MWIVVKPKVRLLTRGQTRAPAQTENQLSYAYGEGELPRTRAHGVLHMRNENNDACECWNVLSSALSPARRLCAT